ncbi:MAG TPA: hypothetical protein VGU45_12595 [Microvirga sp.]|jgi:hypothetical protein|nr:hypothetical protein [Microvirga sp.]
MPVLDAKALKTDRKGLAFLRSVLRREGEPEPKGGKAGEPAQPQTDSKARDR